MLTAQNAQLNAGRRRRSRARRKFEAQNETDATFSDQSQEGGGEKKSGGGGGGSARLRRRGGESAILGTGGGEGRRSRARQLWLKKEKVT